MEHLLPIIKQLKELNKHDLLRVQLELLQTRHLCYTELSDVYVQYLELTQHANSDLIGELAYSLLMFKDKQTAGTWEQAEIKANKALLASGLFKGTLFEKQIIDTLNNLPK